MQRTFSITILAIALSSWPAGATANEECKPRASVYRPLEGIVAATTGTETMFLDVVMGSERFDSLTIHHTEPVRVQPGQRYRTWVSEQDGGFVHDCLPINRGGLESTAGRRDRADSLVDGAQAIHELTSEIRSACKDLVDCEFESAIAFGAGSPARIVGETAACALPCLESATAAMDVAYPRYAKLAVGSDGDRVVAAPKDCSRQECVWAPPALLIGLSVEGGEQKREARRLFDERDYVGAARQVAGQALDRRYRAQDLIYVLGAKLGAEGVDAARALGQPGSPSFYDDALTSDVRLAPDAYERAVGKAIAQNGWSDRPHVLEMWADLVGRRGHSAPQKLREQAAHLYLHAGDLIGTPTARDSYAALAKQVYPDLQNLPAITQATGARHKAEQEFARSVYSGRSASRDEARTEDDRRQRLRRALGEDEGSRRERIKEASQEDRDTSAVFPRSRVFVLAAILAALPWIALWLRRRRLSRRAAD